MTQQPQSLIQRSYEKNQILRAKQNRVLKEKCLRSARLRKMGVLRSKSPASTSLESPNNATQAACGRELSRRRRSEALGQCTCSHLLSVACTHHRGSLLAAV